MARMIDIMQNNGRVYSLPNPDFQHPFKNVRNCGNKRGQIKNHLWKKQWRREKQATLQRKSFRTIWLTFGKCQLENAWKWLACTTVAWSAGVFFGRASDFARKSAMLKLPEERRKLGESKGVGREKRKRRTFFLPSPSTLSSFRPWTYPKGYYFYSPQSSTDIKSKMAATTMRTRTRFRPPKISLHCRLAPQTKLNSGWVRLQNITEILDLGPHLCTRTWLRAMIGLLKKPLWICKSRRKEIQNAIPVIGWVRWGPRTRISALLRRRYWPRLNCVYDAGLELLELGFALRDETKTAAWETRKWTAIESRARLNGVVIPFELRNRTFLLTVVFQTGTNGFLATTLPHSTPHSAVYRRSNYL